MNTMCTILKENTKSTVDRNQDYEENNMYIKIRKDNNIGNLAK